MDTGPVNIKKPKAKGKKKLGNGIDPTPSTSSASGAANPSGPPARKSKNTAIYVSRLPPDATVSEVHETFSKFGLIEIDDTDQPKIKLYANDEGRFNGEALVVYFKEESVDLAIRMLDDVELRLGDASTRMAVRKADFSHKAGDGPQTAKAEYKPRVVDKKAATRRIGKMQR